MIYIGIDVGKKGAIAFIDGRCGTPVPLVYAQPMIGKEPNEPAMKALLDQYINAPRHAYIEKSQPMARPKPGGGVIQEKPKNAFAKGNGYGLWRGMLVMAGIPYEIVAPKKWQGVMLAGENKDDTKAASIRVAKRMFPGVSLLPTDKCRKDSDGMADALLIAEYGRRLHCGELLQQRKESDG